MYIVVFTRGKKRRISNDNDISNAFLWNVALRTKYVHASCFVSVGDLAFCANIGRRRGAHFSLLWDILAGIRTLQRPLDSQPNGLKRLLRTGSTAGETTGCDGCDCYARALSSERGIHYVTLRSQRWRRKNRTGRCRNDVRIEMRAERARFPALFRPTRRPVPVGCASENGDLGL